jgi:hypothetical protein
VLVHCLSAANILLDKELHCKITGFASAEAIRERDTIEKKKKVLLYFSNFLHRLRISILRKNHY